MLDVESQMELPSEEQNTIGMVSQIDPNYYNFIKTFFCPIWVFFPVQFERK